MAKVNWGRLLTGTLLAGVVCFITDGFMHEKMLKQDWMDVYHALKATMPENDGGAMGMGYFGLLEIGRGFLTMFVYAMMRARSGPGPKTAVWAGMVAWFAFCFTGPAQYVPLGLLSCTLWLKAAGIQLIPSILAALAGAAQYKERK